MWHQLGLETILAECGSSRRQRNLPMIEVVSRLVNLYNELATGAWVSRTVFADLLGEKLDYVNKDALYRVSVRLWAAREAIEGALAACERELFGLGETMVLYEVHHQECSPGDLDAQGPAKLSRRCAYRLLRKTLSYPDLWLSPPPSMSSGFYAKQSASSGKPDPHKPATMRIGGLPCAPVDNPLVGTYTYSSC